MRFIHLDRDHVQTSAREHGQDLMGDADPVGEPHVDPHATSKSRP
jgi:hypothetical protein